LGARDTATRAGEIADKTIEEYEAPPMDESIREALAEFVSRRRTELGD
jgi:trimethylamine--corrinoid protein Co-methyltransferase